MPIYQECMILSLCMHTVTGLVLGGFLEFPETSFWLEFIYSRILKRATQELFSQLLFFNSDFPHLEVAIEC